MSGIMHKGSIVGSFQNDCRQNKKIRQVYFQLDLLLAVRSINVGFLSGVHPDCRHSALNEWVVNTSYLLKDLSLKDWAFCWLQPIQRSYKGTFQDLNKTMLPLHRHANLLVGKKRVRFQPRQIHFFTYQYKLT